MLGKNKHICFLCFILAFGIVSAGCDKMSFLEDYFSSLKKKADVATAKTEVPAQTTSSASSKDVLAKIDGWMLTAQELNEKVPYSNK